MRRMLIGSILPRSTPAALSKQRPRERNSFGFRVPGSGLELTTRSELSTPNYEPGTGNPEPRTRNWLMKVEGAHDLHASAERVYQALIDPAVLQRCIPGCERLEKTGENAYSTTLRAGVGSIKGIFTGNV